MSDSDQFELNEIRARGERTGRVLGSLKGLREEVSRESAQYGKDTIDRLQKRRKRLESEKRFHEKRFERYKDTLEKAVQKRDHISRDRFDNPTEYAWIRGALYLFMSGILLVGDVAILGRILAEFVGEEFFSRATEESFLTVLFKEPLSIMEQFPGLAGLVFSIVMMGFFVKVFLDYLERRDHAEEKSQDSRKSRWEAWLYTIVFVLTVITVLVVSLARLTVSATPAEADTALHAAGFGQEGFRRLVSTILGFTLPYAAALFFVNGADKLSNALRYAVAALTMLYHERRIVAVESKVSKATSDLESIDRELEDVNRPEWISGRTSSRLNEAVQGYSEGVAKLLKPGKDGSIYERLLPVALRAALAPRAPGLPAEKRKS